MPTPTVSLELSLEQLDVDQLIVYDEDTRDRHNEFRVG